MLFVENMLKYASEKNGINYDKMIEYCKIYASDKRYKPKFLASTCTWSYNQSGIIRYKGGEYYYRQEGDKVFVENRYH